MKLGCDCGARFWHSKACRSKYVTIRPSGALSIDSRYYVEGPSWQTTMDQLREITMNQQGNVGESVDYLENVVNSYGPDEGVQFDQEEWARLRQHIANVITPLRMRDLRKFP